MIAFAGSICTGTAPLLLTGCMKPEEIRYIPSGAMTPTLQKGDRVSVKNYTGSPKRREIVTFNSPHAWNPELKKGKNRTICALNEIPVIGSILFKAYRNAACDTYIKRVVGLPGDKIKIDQSGRVFVDNVELEEPYVKNFCSSNEDGQSYCSSLETTVPEGHVIVLGDSRNNSWDSRYYPGNPFVPIKEIRGSVTSIVYPLDRAGGLKQP